MKRKTISVCLAALMVLSLFPLQSYAAEESYVKGDFIDRHIVCTGVGENFVITCVSESLIADCKSSDEKVVIADTSSLPAHSVTLTAVSAGSAVLTFYADDGTTYDSADVTVSEAPTAIIASVSSVTLGVGESYALTITAEPADAYCPITYSSNNDNIASVNSDGIITASAVGTAVITATAYNAVETTCAVTVKKAPSESDLSLNKSPLIIGVGDSYSFALSFANSTYWSEVSYSVSDTSIASMKGSKLTAVSVGNTVMTAQLSSGIKVCCDVTVVSAPTMLSINDSVKLGVGETFKITRTFAPDTLNSLSNTYSSSDTSVATVSSGLITAVHTGTTVVRNTAYNGVTSNDCTVTVVSAPSKVTLNKSSVTIGKGEKFALSASFPTNSYSSSLKYSTSNSAVATVSSSGQITGKKAGSAVITVETYNGKTAKCTVTVKNAPSKVTLNKSSANIGKGESIALKVSFPSGSYSASLVYSSSNSSIVSVSSSGKITGKKTGSAVITVKTFNGKTAKCTITVKKSPTKINLNKTSIVIGVGEKFDLNSSVPSGTAAYSRTFSSSNTKIATVKTNGVITASAVGKVKITVKIYNGKTATCTVTVKKAPTSIKLKKSTLTVYYGSVSKLSTVLNSGSASYSLKWSTSNKKIVTVSSTGSVRARGYGSCYITVKTYNGKTAKCKITVKRRAYSYLVSSYTTYFPTDTNLGKPVNLKLACKYINGSTGGKIIVSGGTFSFNSVVGQRTRARGFVDAYITTGSTYTNGIGGGICQAATTIFNAAFYGNFTITERSCHSLKSDYCPVGMDSAIFWGYQDFKFKNNYNCSIKVKMVYNASGSITCKIYSNKKISLKKVTRKVTYNSSSKTYTTKRYYGGVCNYTTYSKYND